jgi:hypothetical protein
MCVVFLCVRLPRAFRGTSTISYPLEWMPHSRGYEIILVRDLELLQVRDFFHSPLPFLPLQHCFVKIFFGSRKVKGERNKSRTSSKSYTLKAPPPRNRFQYRKIFDAGGFYYEMLKKRGRKGKEN